MSTSTTVCPLKVGLDPPLGPDEGVPAGETLDPGLVPADGLVVGLQQNGSRPENTSTFLCLALAGEGAAAGAPWLTGGRGVIASAAFGDLCRNRNHTAATMTRAPSPMRI